LIINNIYKKMFLILQAHDISAIYKRSIPGETSKNIDFYISKLSYRKDLLERLGLSAKVHMASFVRAAWQYLYRDTVF
jgi:hypothetical protein